MQVTEARKLPQRRILAIVAITGPTFQSELVETLIMDLYSPIDAAYRLIMSKKRINASQSNDMCVRKHHGQRP